MKARKVAPRLTAKQRAEMDVLAALPDEKIRTDLIPEMSDLSGGRRGVFYRPKILRNSAQCRRCSEIIESTHRHDFVKCRCAAIGVDGDLDYLKRVGLKENLIEMSKYEYESRE